jgi:hypothetical protein
MDNIKSIDEALKVIISLRTIPESERAWGTVSEAMRQNPLLQTTTDDEITRMKSLRRDTS